MDCVRGVYQTTVQTVAGFAGSTIDTIKCKFTGVTGVAQNHVLPALTKSYADPLVKLSNLAAIDDRESNLAERLEDYAKNRTNANPKDQDKINTTMVKLFYKMTMSQDQSASAKHEYYNCVNVSVIYDRLLKLESTEMRNHPRSISSLAFAFAATLALSLHREGTPQSNLTHNKTSPYFDLSPLYGANEVEASSIRMKDGRGMLRSDSFTEDRLDMLPDAVPALLVLWNRYHNYVAKQLLSYNEDDNWKEPSNLTPEQRLTQDNKIFDIARSITCIHFMNVVREDFLKGLVGMPIAGPSAQVDILFDVRGLRNGKAGYLSSMESYLLYSFSSFAPSSFASEVHQRLQQRKENEASVNPDMRGHNRVGHLCRNELDRFEDNDLAELLFDAIEAKAGCPGGRAVPNWALDENILKLRQARQANVCTLNQFRQHLGLKQLRSFEEWNPELAKTARDMYGDINNLELYPGLLCESSDGSGFGFGYTMTWGLMTDIVTRIRCDPMFTSNFNEHSLTKWGYNDCMSGADANSTFYNTGGSLGGMLPKLLQRTLPHNCPYDNVYCLFPFLVPEKSKAYVESCPNSTKYKVDRPKQVKVKVLRTLQAISEVLNDPHTYPTPYKRNLIDITGGYGHLLGFDELALHDYDVMMTLFSLMPDKGATRRIGELFAQKAQKLLKQRKHDVDDEKIANANARIDVIKDVIDATCIRWVCETICNYDFKDDSMTPSPALKVMEKEREKEQNEREMEQKEREMEQKERDNFAAYHAYIFGNDEPEFGWNVRERALTASMDLRRHLKNQMLRVGGEPRDTGPFNRLGRFFIQLQQEFRNGILVPQHSGFSFLDNMIKASQIKPLRQLARNTNDILEIKEIKEHCKKEAEKELKAGKELTADKSTTLAERIRKEGLKSLMPSFFEDTEFSGYEVEESANQKLEEERVIANVIGLAAILTMHFSKACAQVVDFYLDNSYSDKKDKLVELCGKDRKSSNNEIMKYIWEAMRIRQRLGVWRNTSLDAGQTRTIVQGLGHPDVIIESGDRIFADFTFAHNDPNQIEKPKEVRLGRELNSLLGLGVHKCPAGPFLEQTMPEIFRVIFQLKDLKRASGMEGQLKSTTLRPDTAPGNSELYLNEGGRVDYCPKRMVIEFNSEDLNDDDGVSKLDSASRLIWDRGWPMIVSLVLWITVIVSGTMGIIRLFFMSTPTPIQP